MFQEDMYRDPIELQRQQCLCYQSGTSHSISLLSIPNQDPVCYRSLELRYMCESVWLHY